ncbi:MAG: hypothetical protein GY906_27020 [bacterium]|nr:hypothetical protein [bacterium]
MSDLTKCSVSPCRKGGLMMVLFLTLSSLSTFAQQGSVVDTVHNLSISGPGAIRSTSEDEVCKFCHIPHTAVVATPLWGHALSNVQRYEVAAVRTDEDRAVYAPQPDGSSRLCLSCHDGTVALGDVAGEREPIRMAGSQMLVRGRGGYIGTDLSGSHPISFVVPESDISGPGGDRDIGTRPLSAIKDDFFVKLDEDGKMQCTSCHDPHRDENFRPGKVPHFWVKSTVEEVCLTCHELR